MCVVGVQRLCVCGGCAEAVCVWWVCQRLCVCAEAICVWWVCQRLCVWCMCSDHSDSVFWTDVAVTSWSLRQARSSFLTNTLSLYSSISSLLCLKIGAQTPTHTLK